MKDLTPKQRKFTDAYMGEAQGNATAAARLAGYKGNDNTLSSVGDENLRKPAIAAAIKERADSSPLIAGRDEIQKFWSQGMRGELEGVDPVKTSELLAKSQAMFITKIEVKATMESWLTRIQEDDDGE